MIAISFPSITIPVSKENKNLAKDIMSSKVIEAFYQIAELETIHYQFQDHDPYQEQHNRLKITKIESEK